MPSPRYRVSAKADSVEAHWESRPRSIPVRILGILAMIALAAAWMYYAVFRVGHRYTAWWVFKYEAVGSRHFIEAIIGSLLNLALVSFFLAWGVRSLFPSGERLRCDRSQFVVSKIPWINFNGRWTTLSFPLSEVAEVEYVILQRGGGRSPAVYGIRFWADGKRRTALERLEPPEAGHLLRELRRLGVDVWHDPQMRTLINETLGDRREQI